MFHGFANTRLFQCKAICDIDIISADTNINNVWEKLFSTNINYMTIIYFLKKCFTNHSLNINRTIQNEVPRFTN